MSVKSKIAATTVCLACMLCCVAGCAPQAQEEQAPASTPAASEKSEESAVTPEQQKVIDGEEGITNADINEDAYPGKEYLDGLWDRWEAIGEEHAPEIRTLPDGKMVQRTPTEYEVNPDAWQIQAGSNSYNTYWLGADNRGCESCHADLDALLKNLPYEHPVAWNDTLDNETTLQQCLLLPLLRSRLHCQVVRVRHPDARHPLHRPRQGQVRRRVRGHWMSCHNATENGQDMELWDLPSTIACGASTRLKTSRASSASSRKPSTARTKCFDDRWTLTTTTCATGRRQRPEPRNASEPVRQLEIHHRGQRAQPLHRQASRPNAEAEEAGVIVTKASKMVCDWNPVGGGGVTNTEVTGIPVSWLVEKAGGYLNDTTGVRVLRADGSSKRAFPKNKLDENEALLVYKIGGEYLDATRGYPCTNWVEGVDVNQLQAGRQLQGDQRRHRLHRQVGRQPQRRQNENGDAMNKPNATILGIPIC